VKRCIRTVEEEIPATGNVGIWWSYNNKLAHCLKCPLDSGIVSNGFISYSQDVIPIGVQNLIDSYGTFGKVVYDIRSQVYLIVCDQRLTKDRNAIKLIADEFEISDQRWEIKNEKVH